MAPLPRHEAEIERRALRDCLHALRHPRQLPGLARGSWRDTRDYYAGRDLADVERAELVEIVAFTRVAGIKMAGLALFLGVAVVVLVWFKYKLAAWKTNRLSAGISSHSSEVRETALGSACICKLVDRRSHRRSPT
ncbi:hypothetical protein F5X99DRAFT_404813 [Biscogniauxia marginata]|nr:hypothetical protein F5X99DRAFT_404813 [Biscogniauxia marginata]